MSFHQCSLIITDTDYEVDKISYDLEGDDTGNCYILPLPYERAGDISALLNTSIQFTSTPIIALISKKAIASEDLGAVHLGQLLLQNNANASKIAHIKLSLEKEISEIEFLLYDPTLMECLLKIHESNFFYLHDQYREIAVRDGGINSRDGWLKLQLPEYYILKNRKDKGYDIIRYNRIL